MNYTINEIPDEAVALSGNEMIPIWQGETKKVSVATLASSCIPVGAVMPFANGTTSEDWLLCDGRDTTGTAEELATHYPALYTYLENSNVLPKEEWQGELSALETISIGSTSGTATTMDYDGVLYIMYNSMGNTPGRYFINGTEVIQFDGGYSSARNGATLYVKKGDVVYAHTTDSSPHCSARFYKNPKNCYIKAT